MKRKKNLQIFCFFFSRIKKCIKKKLPCGFDENVLSTYEKFIIHETRHTKSRIYTRLWEFLTYMSLKKKSIQSEEILINFLNEKEMEGKKKEVKNLVHPVMSAGIFTVAG